MQVAGSGDTWTWSADVFQPVAFCVKALVQDGLRVPPFNLHPDGDGGLRRAGLDAQIWRDWVGAVVRQRTEFSRLVQELLRNQDRQDLRESALAAATGLQEPGSLCPGSADLVGRLNDLWISYMPEADAWKEQMTRHHSLHLEAPAQRRLWKELLVFHETLATISVFIIPYVGPVVMVLPPTICLIAPADGPYTFADQVLEAARELSEAH